MKFEFLKKLGPGLLFAGAAIGVSHLVQSTRAGADFGFGLLWALLTIHVVKYPFFQYGPRYATATGESLIDGYAKLGKWVLALYFIITFATMFTIQAAVTIVTAGLASNLFGITDNIALWSVIITIVCFFILQAGKYKFLDQFIKVIILILTLSTVFAVGFAHSGYTETLNFVQVLPKGTLEVAFLISFLGWMPAPLDIATWHSLWALEKDKTEKQSARNFSPRNALFDFNVGYLGTVFLAICFLSLGVLIMHHSGKTFSDKAGTFAQELIGLYTQNLGTKSAVFIGIAAFTTMFSTTLTTLDASPRAMARSVELLFKRVFPHNYLGWMILLAAGTIIILTVFISNMLTMVKIATILSFVTAPFYAIANFMLISGKHTPREWHPSMGLKILSYIGIIFLIGFNIWYFIEGWS